MSDNNGYMDGMLTVGHIWDSRKSWRFFLRQKKKFGANLGLNLKFGIFFMELGHSTPYYARANGQVKASIKIIVNFT